MKNIIYTALTLVGLFMTFTESSSVVYNIIGIVILVAVAAKTGVINIREIFNK